MTDSLRRGAPLALVLSLLAGCASLPPDRGKQDVDALLDARGVPVATAHSDSSAEIDRAVSSLLAEPLQPDDALRVALLRSPKLRREYARLGLAWAEVFEATRLPNPGFGFSRQRDEHGGLKITRSLSLDLADLMLLPSRSRLALADFERERLKIAATILSVASQVEASWYRYVGARQVADMRAAVARAAELSAELAGRFHAAGNISELQLRQEQAVASQARIVAARAAARALQRRAELNAAMGLSGREAQAWQASERLPLPVDEEDEIEVLLALAREHRLDLLAAQREAAVLGDAEAVVRRWRWLGGAQIGFEQEQETGGGRLQGPEIGIELPLFHQGQGRIARAEALRARSQAALAQLELEIEGEIRAGAERVRAMKAVAEAYRAALVPQREAIVARQQERFNFMLIGAFELIQAKREEYDAYQGYLEAIRDYWLARAALARAVGARLPSESRVGGLTPSVEDLLAPSDKAMDHGSHGNHDDRDGHRQHDGHEGHDRHDGQAAPPGEDEDHHHHHLGHDGHHGGQR
ncbi:TolC family protein [Rehaibacterium terrae]|uniref:Outer membrane protein TolC n=1 Tax=Rehaibacterium terrae TaxID=1341696 RepID=A0A7W7XYW8_9GAMM|nr:TolC family protein [Rehaibacterium terrae]MBB5014976.1 outer membrane protein TolC [Rehaibacterium terrae]